MPRRGVSPHDVAFDIHFAGICHTDIRIVKGGWGMTPNPVEPGHEIASVVTAVGSEVTKTAAQQTAPTHRKKVVEGYGEVHHLIS